MSRTQNDSLTDTQGYYIGFVCLVLLDNDNHRQAYIMNYSLPHIPVITWKITTNILFIYLSLLSILLEYNCKEKTYFVWMEWCRQSVKKYSWYYIFLTCLCVSDMCVFLKYVHFWYVCVFDMCVFDYIYMCVCFWHVCVFDLCVFDMCMVCVSDMLGVVTDDPVMLCV
jgi:hypothetical protein